MTSQRFCLRWNNHQSNLLSVFDQLLQDESFVDVTLAVDGRNLKAHKIVLSACSPYFQALFVGHPDRHPIVILKDIPYVDMRSLLDFMYRGEVSVDQDRLTMFLKVAESLRIKGLTEASGDNCDTLAKMGSTLTTAPHPYSGALGFPPSRLKRPLSGSQHSLNSLQASNPLLGSALTGPKRKRGLPRKLSGSLSSGLDVMPDREEEEEEREEEEEEEREEEEEFDEERSGQSDSDMIERAHSPFDNKMLEVNVSEGKPPPHHHHLPLHPPPGPPSPQDQEEDDSSSVCNMMEGERDGGGEGGRSPPLPASASSPRREEDEEKKPSPQEVSANAKKERESEATSGGDQSDRNSSPVPERFPPGLLRLIPRSELISKDKLDAPEPTRGRPKANGNQNQAFDNLHLLKSLIMNNNVEDFANTDENRAQFLSQFSNEHKFILSQLEQFQKTNKKDMLANSNFSLHVQSQHIHQMLTNNNNNNNGGVNENHNFLAPNNAGSSPLAVKRRIRRRATSGSDPTESLTEMSVRGLNLFRYASVTEGIYKCMECAKVDVIKTFKNKYSFQRHAFLYHEGCQRKVFPCPVCGKEFSRPDKMKNHMKTVHDCFMPATSPAGGRGPRSSPLMLDFAKDGVFDSKSLVHNLSIFAAGTKGGVGNAPSTAPLPLVPFYLPP